jgi:hypothetical protein
MSALIDFMMFETVPSVATDTRFEVVFSSDFYSVLSINQQYIHYLVRPYLIPMRDHLGITVNVDVSHFHSCALFRRTFLKFLYNKFSDICSLKM